MTRFARAKGSKSSNERVPEEATSWSTMKQQLLEKNKELEDSQNRQKFLNQRNASYKAFLEEKASEGWKKTEWAEFPGITKTKVKKSIEKKHEKAIKNFVNHVSCEENDFNDEELSALKIKVDKALQKSEIYENDSDKCSIEVPPTEQSLKTDIPVPLIRAKISKNKKLKILVDNQNQLEDEGKTNSIKVNKKQKKDTTHTTSKKKKKIPNNNDTINKPDGAIDKNTSDASVKNIKSTKKNKIPNSTNKEINKKHSKIKKQTPVKKVVKENLTEDELKKIEKKKEKKLKQLEKRKKKKAELKMLKEQESQALNSEENIEVSNQKQHVNESVKNEKSFHKVNSPGFPKKPLKLPKVRDNEEHHRRKPHQPHKMFINGKELEIDYIEGFPVKKEDSLRLKKLRKEMISKGLPRSEINIALKLERRKAEKALAREKKKVCFNCRKSGHNLSECPELNKNQVAPTSGGGICFKCGSTEHTHFECKVVRGQNFNYAHCFVCNEQGHIARQCPDNPKGLYPKGGACKVCGDVTHLKKDCPKYQSQQQKQEDSFKIETYGGNNPDDLEGNNSSSMVIPNKRSNKIIKF